MGTGAAEEKGRMQCNKDESAIAQTRAGDSLTRLEEAKG